MLGLKFNMNLSDFARRPISIEMPSGINPNSLDDFSEIKREVNKLNTVTSKISWKHVFKLSKSILESESKDIRCACYYTVSATHIDGLKGLVNGLNALLDICVIYWHSGYPDVNKTIARMGAFEWLTEHAIKKQKTLKISPTDLVLIETGHKLTLKIEEELRSHYGNKSPSLGAIRRIFSQWIEEIQATKLSLEEQRLKKEAIEKQNNSGINVNVSLPPRDESKQTVQPTMTHTAKDKNIKPMVTISLAFIFILTLLFGHFLYADNQKSTLLINIQKADLTTINPLISQLENKEDDLKQYVKTALIKQALHLNKDWEVTSTKVDKINELETLNHSLKNLYPDSAAVKKLEYEFNQQRADFENEYSDIHQRFLKSRTIFANAKNHNSDENIVKAYSYSNSLFPLLGRIEYAEKQNSLEELDRTQYLLNVYQHKLNTIRKNIQQ
ncbi:type VI secretion system ImpA family N-terminal domain-containing protein [Aliivibrio fischeri]|uniref:type VI secretion system ImpA family N-terminal domain-containing protein n=2 Tax=Aliivibrio fischeri TaxID=668 RepID=UPI002090EF88|nr:type VI secretion system ImpA family N-terminal domain-containing protein [Aliivibrio fischeri]USR96967.1 type VI secretion system ImpA family N-terminal domain-containing protein [Aliivibrio fischeri ATCC 7744 = JCM 18803 = DSM 507]